MKPNLKTSIAVLLSTVLPALAQVSTWTGGGGDANWSTTGNWSPGAPNPGDSLIFTGATQTSPNNDNTATNGYGGITFDATAGNFDLLGTAIDFAGVIQNDSANAQAIDLQIILTNATIVNVTNGIINIGMNAGGISGAGSLTVNGILGGGSLTVSNKTYSGGTIINSGATMNVWNDSGSYTLAGGELLLNFGSWYSGANYAFTADSSLGVNVAGNYNSKGRYDSYGTIGSPGFKWTVVGNGRFQIFGHVAAGSVEVTSGAVLGALANGSTNFTGLGTNTITVDYNAGLRINNGGIVLAPIVLNGGNGPDGNGALEANQEGYSGLAYVPTATFSNTITLLNDNGDTYFGAQTAGGTVGANLAIAGNITGPGGLQKIGPHLLNLSGTNTYGGNTTINAGTVQVGSPGALPHGSTNGYVILYGTSKLDINGFNATVNYLQDDGNKNDMVDNSSTNPASLTLFNGGTVISGAVGNSGGGALSIINVSGSAQLIGVNSYSGSNVVQGGSLEINIPTGTSTGGLVGVADGGTLTLDFTGPGSSLKASGVALAILPEITDSVPRLTEASIAPACVVLSNANLSDIGWDHSIVPSRVMFFSRTFVTLSAMSRILI